MLKYFNTSHVSINPSLYRKCGFPAYISIHPMFLLILGTARPKPKFHDFNTSHVSINQKETKFHGSCEANFNTSHVSINQNQGILFISLYPISIHLMFLLINFRRNLVRNWIFISIHLMFLLIAKLLLYARENDLFQYISCFY